METYTVPVSVGDVRMVRDKSGNWVPVTVTGVHHTVRIDLSNGITVRVGQIRKDEAE